MPNSRTGRLDHIRERQDKYRRKYVNPDDQPPVMFQQGDEVLMKELRPARDNAFHPVWVGPCTVVQIISDVIYMVERDGMIVKVHLDDLRPNPSPEPLSYELNPITQTNSESSQSEPEDDGDTDPDCSGDESNTEQSEDEDPLSN